MATEALIKVEHLYSVSAFSEVYVVHVLILSFKVLLNITEILNTLC